MKDVRGLEIEKYCFKIAIEAILFEPLRFKEVFYLDQYLEFNIFFLFLSRFFFSHFWYVLVFH